MTEFRIENFSIRGHRVGKGSWFPAIRELIKSEISARLDEDDGLFIGYGILPDGLPYTLQDDYDGPEDELTFRSAVLENEYLKAVFLPELGGRLWSIYDKENKRDLILSNTRFIPCNLAIRNAWFAGGVEFNCGRRGHDAQTVSPRFAAVVKTADFPVLRIYEYQRDRGTPFQYDCFLPEGSRFLYIRGRIYNPNEYVVPMYWWSNIAAAEVEGSRVVVPAMDTFSNWYSNGSHALAKLSLPDGEGFDGTYPANFSHVRDHFYNIPEDTRRYECLFMPDGYGFCHVSTRRLRGRKLFVWGQSQGGRHWNRKLLGPGLDSYIELQAGLARSQQECLPMPPKTAWEWLEGYGNLTMEPHKVFGTWENAVSSVSAAIDERIPEAELDRILRETKESVALRQGEVFLRGSGWGALEEKRRGGKLAPQLDFSCPEGDAELRDWLDLLENSRIRGDFPVSYQTGDEWFRLLKKAEESWQKHYHLALHYFRREDWDQAEREAGAAGDPSRNRHLLHLLANIRRMQKRNDESAALIFQAGALDPRDKSFLKEVFKMLLELEEYGRMLNLHNMLAPDLRSVPLVKFMHACALARTGSLDAAESILLENGGLDIPDIREGENSTSGLYLYIREQKAKRAGIPFDAEKTPVPFSLDLRMS